MMNFVGLFTVAAILAIVNAKAEFDVKFDSGGKAKDAGGAAVDYVKFSPFEWHNFRLKNWYLICGSPNRHLAFLF